MTILVMLEHRFTVISPAYSVCSLKPCEKCVLENSSRLRQACGAKKAAEGVVITVPVYSVYVAVYHRKSSVRLTGLPTFTAQVPWLKTQNVQEHSSSARYIYYTI